VDPVSLVGVVLAALSLIVTVVVSLSSVSFNILARDNWLKYLSNRNPRFNEFVGIVLKGKLGRYGWDTVLVMVPFVLCSVSPLALALFAPARAAVVGAVVLGAVAATSAIITVTTRWLFVRSLNDQHYLRLVSATWPISQVPMQAKRRAARYSALEAQRSFSIYIAEPYLLMTLLLSGAFGWPENLALAVVLLVVGSLVAVKGYGFLIDTRYEVENALFIAMRAGTPQLSARVDIFHVNGGQFTDEEIIGVGQKLRFRNPQGRVMDLRWRRVEGMGVWGSGNDPP